MTVDHVVDFVNPIDPDLLPDGTVLHGGAMRIDRLLGRGGMSTVYEAMLANGNTVALKIIATKFAMDREYQLRFENEARLAGSLADLPFVVRVHELGRMPELGDRLFMTMPCIRAPTLELVLLAGPMSPLDACKVARALADALVSLHARGVVHRDIKPGNVLLDRDGTGYRVWLLDFGYAYSLGSEGVPATAGLTAADHRPGTKEYMAPEQALGFTPTASFDVYALAVTLHEALTGRIPFYGNLPAEIVRRKCDPRFELPSIGERMHELPGALVRLVDKALARTPEERIESAQELRNRLDEVIAELELDVPRSRESLGGGADQTVAMPAGTIPKPPKVMLAPSVDPEWLARQEAERVAAVEAERVRVQEEMRAQAVSSAPDVAPPIVRPHVVRAPAPRGAGAARVLAVIFVLAAAAGVWRAWSRVESWLAPAGTAPAAVVVESEDVETPAHGEVSVAAPPEPAPTAPAPTAIEAPAVVPTVEPEPSPAKAPSITPAPRVQEHSTAEPRIPAVAPEKPKPIGPTTPASPEPARTAPDVTSASCVKAREDAAAAKAKQDWDAVLRSTSERACWSTAAERVRLRVRALLELGKLDKCVREGSSSTDAKVIALVEFCRQGSNK